MKLSEAIRAGAKLHPQGRGGFVSHVRRFFGFGPKVKAICALMAAYEAAGVPTIYTGSDRSEGIERGEAKGDFAYAVSDEWWEILNTAWTCPVCLQSGVVGEQIPHLNDDHGWTREKIADWVEAIEFAANRPQTLAETVRR